MNHIFMCSNSTRTFLFALLFLVLTEICRSQSLVDSVQVKKYIEIFNLDDEETKINYIDNKSVWHWLKSNVPFFECPDKATERTYYFRWWTYRKHIKQTPDGFVITEFLPDVSWAGKHNTITCPAGHHFYEGHWLKNKQFLDDYARFWFRKGGEPRRYSFWAADAIYNHYLVHQDKQFVVDLLPELVKNYEEWEKSHLDNNGLFWQIDDRDGMEVSIGGSGYRATINSFMYGDAMAISKIATLAGKNDLAASYKSKADAIKVKVQELLWDDKEQFFKVLPKGKDTTLAEVRELHGFVPWYFNLPEGKYEIAWKQLMDKEGFYAPFRPTSAEQRSPKFMFKHHHECLWNGPSWPFATTQTLVGLANVLNSSNQTYISKEDYFELLSIYTKSHFRKREDGKTISWIDENLDPFTGEWIARTMMFKANREDKDRGKDYNHSAYNDLIISGLIRLRATEGDAIEINPLLPQGKWDYFCLENVNFKKRNLTILYDKSGLRYKKGKGLIVLEGGKEIARKPGIAKIRIN